MTPDRNGSPRRQYDHKQPQTPDGDSASIIAAGAGGVVTAERNQVVNNDAGVQVLSGATVRLCDNAIFDNGTGLTGCSKDPAVGTIATFKNNRIEGNGGNVNFAECKPATKLEQQ